MYNIIGILGPSGSGKDSLLNEIIKQAQEENILINPIVLTTTRPMRDGERHGFNYYFTDVKSYCDNPNIIGSTCFNTNWFYGIDKQYLCEDRVNIAVLNPRMALELQYEENIKLHCIHLAVAPQDRLMRQLAREKEPNCKEICRRFLADSEDEILYEDLEWRYMLLNSNIADQKFNAKFILDMTRATQHSDQISK